MKRFYLYLLLFLSFACSNQQNSEVEKWEAQAANIEIIRDDFGVPHIYGNTDADAVFGLLYAQCEDDFNRVEQNYIWATGRLAEVEGESALYSDLRAKLFMTKEEAIENYNNSPEWLRKLCDAFADGINYFLFTHPEVKPKLLTHFEPWMPMYFSEGSIGGDIERLSTRKIKEFYDKNNPIALSNIDEGLMRLDKNIPSGSNGFAIGGQHTESGNAMLLINPHTSFFFRGEVHVVSKEGLNAYGAVTWGQFFVYQGFNEKNGWMHTSVYTDRIDEFAETTEKKDGKLYYKYGEELRPVDSVEVTLKYQGGTVQKERNFIIYRTHHGPVTHEEDGKMVTTGMMWTPIPALEQSFIRTKTNNHKEFREMMDIRANSSNNTVYADADGTIAYYHGNWMPVKNTEVDYSGVVDGSDPKTDWHGIHAVDECIKVVNPPNGWIQNCNSTPFTSALEYSPKKEDYAPYMSIDQENYRGLHAVQLLQKINGLTLDKLIETAYDPYLPGFKALIPGLIVAVESLAKNESNLVSAVEELKKWDYRVSTDSEAMTLAHFYGLACLRQGKFPRGLSLMERIEFAGTEMDYNIRVELFKLVLDKLEGDFGKSLVPWGEVNRYQRLDGAVEQKFDDDKASIPVGLASGNWGALASFNARPGNQNKKIYGVSGNSFVAVVEFGDKVKAKTMLAGGQSGDPESPHFDDQAQRYADVKFKDVAYYKEDVEKRAEKRYRPGE